MNARAVSAAEVRLDSSIAGVNISAGVLANGLLSIATNRLYLCKMYADEQQQI